MIILTSTIGIYCDYMLLCIYCLGCSCNTNWL